jgi:hypothetical protein
MLKIFISTLMFIHVCQGGGLFVTPEDTETTNVPTSYTTVCTGGSISDGNGGCYYADSCEMIYGPCDCFGRSECCDSDSCFIPCPPDSSGGRNRRCLPPIVSTVAPEPTKPAHNKCFKN